MTKRSDAEGKEVTSIVKLLEDCSERNTNVIRKWRENYDMFVYGSRFSDKQDWQVQFSVNKFASAIRTCQGELMATLINVPNWWTLKPKSNNNSKAELLRDPLYKVCNYYLDASNFKRHAGEFFLNSLISMGSAYIGWKQLLIQNPEYVLQQTKKARQETQTRLAKHVENPQVSDELSGDELEQSILDATNALVAAATGEERVDLAPEAKPYIQVGMIDFQDPNHERVYWDPTVSYMEDSPWKAFEYEVNLYELKQMAKLGFLSKSRVNSISREMPIEQEAAYNIRYKSQQTSTTTKSAGKVLVTVFMGPLIVDDEIKKDQVFYIIANRSTILKKGDYPFWEPPGHKTAVINSAVKRIPGRPTGAGIGDNALELQKVYDSNWQLICDTFRFGIAGINIVDYQSLVDKSALKEGIEPGKTIQVRGDPKKVFHREQLTANLENQVTPVQEMLRLAIEDLLGINSAMTGGPNARSRTTATETEGMLAGSQRTVNTIALDLEENYIRPLLQKVLARVLQFGLEELDSNPDLMNVLSEGEVIELKQLNDKSRMEILQTYYEFEIRGFSAKQDRAEKLTRMNEVLSIINSGGPLAMLIDLPKFMELWAELMELQSDDILIVKDSPLALVEAENTSLMASHMVMPSEQDDHELHLKLQGPLAAAPYATPELLQHVQMHQEILMMQQQMMAEQQAMQQEANKPPPAAPTRTRVQFQPDQNGSRQAFIDEVPQ